MNPLRVTDFHLNNPLGQNNPTVLIINKKVFFYPLQPYNIVHLGFGEFLYREKHSKIEQVNIMAHFTKLIKEKKKAYTVVWVFCLRFIL